MALRFTIGRLVTITGGLLGVLRPRWGLRGSLFAAFAVIAAMAIVISAGAGMVLGHLGGAMVELSGRDIPRLAASLQLSEQSASLASQGPSLLAAQNEEILKERARKMKETQAVTLAKLGEIIALGADKAVVSALAETVKNIDEMIQSLGNAARERLETGAQHEKLYGAVRAAQTAFVKAAGPAMIGAQTQLNGIFGAADFSQDEATKAEQVVEQLGDVVAGGNLMAFNLISALSSDSSDTLESIETEFRTAQKRVKSNLDLLPSDSSTTALRAAAAVVMALGEGKSGVFKIRQKELDAADYGQTILEESRKLNVGLGISVQQLVDGVRTATDTSTSQARQEISLATTVMLALGAASLIGSVLFVWLYVGRNILRRIGNLQRSMQLLSSGDLATEIYRSSQHDEIAAMANSLQVFRESMIEARALNTEQDKDRIAKAERASRMEARIVDFEATVRGALDTLQTSANSMQTTAQAMSVTRINPARWSARWHPPPRKPRSTCRRCPRAPSNCRHRSPKSAARWSLRRKSPARPSMMPAPPTPPCKGLPTTPAASASWSTSFRPSPRRPTCSRSTPPSRPRAPARPAADLPWSLPRSRASPTRPRRRPTKSASRSPACRR